MAEQVAALDESRAFPRVNASAVVHAVKKPTIAAIRGYCFGGGALLAIHCDIRIGGDDARLKFHGASYGRAPGAAVLPRIVGEAKAKQLLFTGDEVSADEALRIGLLNQLVPADTVVETAVAMAAHSIQTLGDRIIVAPASAPGRADRATRAPPGQSTCVGPVISRAQQARGWRNPELGRTPDSAARFRSAAERVIGGPTAPT